MKSSKTGHTSAKDLDLSKNQGNARFVTITFLILVICNGKFMFITCQAFFDYRDKTSKFTLYLLFQELLFSGHSWSLMSFEKQLIFLNCMNIKIRYPIYLCYFPPHILIIHKSLHSHKEPSLNLIFFNQEATSISP